MRAITRPIPNPKPAVGSRSVAIEDGVLFELADIACRSDLLRVLPLPTALSAGLVDLLEEIPFSSLRQTPSYRVEDRLGVLLQAAAGAFTRACAHYGDQIWSGLRFGFCLDFGTRLPRSSSEPPYRFVRMHCGPDETGEVVITLSLPDEL